MDLQVSRKCIFNLLAENEFIIPPYQREYAWDTEQCEILWEDLEEFYKKHNENEEERPYFLGTIVCYQEKENKELQVIDGQQRIITFLLLLKAMYRKLEKIKSDNLKETDKIIQGLQNQIAPCIWQVDRMTQKPNFKETRIETKVYTNTDYNNHLQKVFSDEDLKNDDCKFETQYKYVQNYQLLIKKIDELSPSNVLGVGGSLFEFIVCLKRSCVLLPITCADLEMGLKIFHTLNDRGMPLSNADIFKHQLYTNYTNENRETFFNKEWTDINDLCNAGEKKIEIDNIFRCYMHVIRAERETTGNVKGLRNFYLQENKDYLQKNKDTLISDIKTQAMNWSAILNEFPEDFYPEKFKDVHEESKKYLHILSRYPSNEWWQNTVSVLLHKRSIDEFNNPLRKITAALYFQYLKTPNVVRIRQKAYVINNNIYHDKEILHNVFVPEEITKEEIQGVIENFIEKRTAQQIVPGLLTLYAYLDKDQQYITTGIHNFQIEHILPKKWQNKNYNGWTEDDAYQHINSIGNKVLCEKKLNIQAGNGYFNNKKEQYRRSAIHELRSLSEKQEQEDWLPTNIEQRAEHMTKIFTDFFYQEFHP